MSQLTTNNQNQRSVREVINDLTSTGTMAKTLNEILGNRKSQFLSTIVTMVNSDQKLLQIFNDNPLSILSTAIQIVNLDLPLGNQFGFAYIIPRYNGRTGKNEAQLMIGYKGLLQMAIRSGRYKTIKVVPIRQGELKGFNPIDGSVELNSIQNPVERSKLPVIGYLGILQFLNGFSYQNFVTREEIVEREKKFRQGASMSAAWEKNFDAMAEKTVLKMMLSRYGYVGFGDNATAQSYSDSDESQSYVDPSTGEIIDIEEPIDAAAE